EDVMGPITIMSEIKDAVRDEKLQGRMCAQLKGKLPVSFPDLTRLENLDLSNNNFTGILPTQIVSLKNLYNLNLSRDNFIGQIPSSFGYMVDLTNLDLSANQLNGSIPPALITNLHKLKTLDLSNNNLHGPIPSELEKLSSLYYLDLSSNQLSGNISLANPCFLSNLNLSKNLMMGAITSVRDCRYLEYLDISGNHFVGEALNHCDFPDLLLLNQSQNHLTGEMVWSSNKLRSEKSTCNEHKRRKQHVQYNIARHQRRPSQTPVVTTKTHHHHNPPKPYIKKPTGVIYADVITGNKNQSNRHIMNLPTPVSPASYQHPSNSVIAELKSAKGATNTHNLIRDEGFEDFSIKYLGGLFLLLNLPDNETTVNIFSNTTLASYFKSLVPWTNDFLIEDRVTWLAISGLPPKMWTPDTFTAIANHWGDVIVLEDCNPRQFNRTTGRVLIPVRILEFDGEIDSLFNGYIIDSSSREEDDDEVDEDATDEDNDNDSKDELEEDVNSATNGAPAIGNFENRNKDGNTLCGNFGKYKPSDNFPDHKSNEGSTSNVVCGVNDKKENIPPSDKAICLCGSVCSFNKVTRPDIQRKKKFKSLRLIDTILSHLNRAIPSNSSSKSYNEAISDSFSIINRCNIRILSKPDVATSSESNEVDNTIDVGNEIGFTMTGKNKDIENILAKGDMNRLVLKSMWKNSQFDYVVKNSDENSRGIVAIWDNTLFTLSSSLGGDGFLAIVGNCLIPVRILEFDGEIDSLFNGYIIDSSSREEDDDEVDEDATDEDNDNDSKDELEEDVNSATKEAPTIENFENRNKDDCKTLKTSSNSDDVRWELKGDENSRIFHGMINNRRNCFRINWLNIQGMGNEISFTMTGKNKDIENILAKGDMNRLVLKSMWINSQFENVVKNSEGNSGGIVAIWDNTLFTLSSSLEGDGFLAIVGNWYTRRLQ
ncbi:cytochrome P450, partial [Tanacetum coccineum]